MLSALRLALIGLSLSFSTSHSMAAYPERPIMVIVPFQAGSSVDALLRLVCDRVGLRIGQPLVLDFRPGAGGLVGAAAAATAKPDGYTLAFLTSTHAGLPGLHGKMPYETSTAFEPIALITKTPLVMLSGAGQKGSLTELLVDVKAQPGRFNYGSAGNGTPSHLAFELFKQQTGTFLVHIPYRGAPAYVQDLMGGQLQFGFEPAPTGIGLARGDKLRALAVTSDSRLPQLPDVPTLREQGVNLTYYGWGGFVAPAGTPPDIIAKLSTALKDVSAMPEVRQRFEAVSTSLVWTSPEEFRTHFAYEVKRLTAVIQRAGIKAD